MDDHATLTHFVRVTLGCGCPDEIVAQTVVDAVEGQGRGLDVGGRLLVRLLPSDDLDTLVDEFPETVRRLRDERDSRGFQRLRMVVAHREVEIVADVLSRMLQVLAVGDDRVHIHVVADSEIPAALAENVRSS